MKVKKVSQRSVARMLKAGKPLAGLLVGLSSTLGAAAERESPGLLSVLTTASEHEWPMAVSMTITKANCDEAADMFVAAALSGASRIQMGAMMAEGRGRERKVPRLSSYSAGNHMNRLSMTTQRLRAINPAIVDDSLEGAGV